MDGPTGWPDGPSGAFSLSHPAITLAPLQDMALPSPAQHQGKL